MFLERAAIHAASTRAERSHRFAFPVTPLTRLPALSLLPGHNFAQDATTTAVSDNILTGKDETGPVEKKFRQNLPQA
jgi:hypothetical protein